MAISAPIDATKTPAWAALQKHHDELVEKGISLKDWFAADPDRVEKLSYRAGDLYFDLSKNLVTDETLKLLVDLGRACGVEERRDAMFSGEHINTTEDRAVLHTARQPEGRAHRRRPGCRCRCSRGPRSYVRLCRSRSLR